MSALAILWLLLTGLPPGAAPAGPSATLSFVDDRGTSIEAGLTVCFQIELRNDCTTVTGGTVALPASFQSVRVEGAGHGPVSAPKGELEHDQRGHTTLRIPRKGSLAVTSGSWPLTLSLYPRQDDTFRKPSYRSTLKDAGPIPVPAGDFVASFSEPGRAPDLHLLSIPPATRVKASYVRRDGWTLLLRSYDALDRRSVADDGAPASGALCRLLNYARTRVPGKAGAETLSEGKANGGGICVSSRVAAGTYTLEVRPSESQSAVEQDVLVENGQTIGQGHPSGYATTVTVAPLSTAELEITRSD